LGRQRIVAPVATAIAVVIATLSAFVGVAAAATLPGAPTIGTATAGNAQATVSWTTPVSDGGSPITGYVVTPFTGLVAKPSTTFNSTATTQTVTGLANGTAYRFKVAAINAVGTGPMSTTSNQVTPATVPNAPTIGIATAGVAQATVSWTAPAFNGGSLITGYTVTPYVSGVAQPASTFNSTATTQTLTGLSNGTSYRFRVQAINAVGTGGQSGESNTVIAAPSVPDAPTIGTATGGIAQATVTWTAPAFDGGTPITGYEVTPYIGSTALAAVVFNSTLTTQTVTGLSNSTTYTFTVAATNSVGFGGQSAQSNAVTPASAPNAPTIGTATGSNHQATVSWTAPAFDGGAPITGYVVTPFVGLIAKPSTTFNSTATAQTITGLTNGTTYRFRVAAINAVGTGAQSTASNAVTPAPIPPDAPVMGFAVAGDGSATVSWTAPGSDGGAPVTGYVVTPYVGAVAQPSTTFNSTATIQTVTGLTNATTYTFKVAAKNSAGTGAQSAASNAVTPVGAPEAPTVGLATADNAQATVSWTAPASNGGSSILGYVVTPYISGVPQPSTTFNSTATTQTIAPLTNGTTYTFRVQAFNAIGIGPLSLESNAVTPATVPDVPVFVTATPGDQSATVSWFTPFFDGGSPITAYVVTPYISGVPQAPTTFNSPATTEVVTGLTNGTDYTFTVVALNAVGPSGSSSPSNDVVPASVPDAPTIGTATAGIGSATVSWTAPAFDGGSALIGYVVTPYIGGVAQSPVTFFSTATTQVVTGLADGMTYRFSVQAFNAIGTGGSSAQSDSVTVTPIIPGAPTIGSATFGNTQANLTWTAPTSDGGSPITGYEVTPYIATVAQPSIVFNDTATVQTITGLTNGTAYRFTVAAINAVGFGPQSGFSNVVTPATVPDAPTIGTAIRGNTSATVSWTPGSNGGAPITAYIVTPYISGLPQPATTFNSTATTQTVTSLANGTTYTFTVEAVNVAGTSAESGQSNAVTPATVAGMPTIGTATAGNTQATVSWTAPSSDGGSPITGYIVTAYVGINPVLQTPYNSTATTQVFSGLTNGTTYRFRVRAVNSVGNSAFSTTSNAVTPQPTVADAPTIGTATAGNAQAAVTWTAPAFNGNSTITGYVVTPYIASVAQASVPLNSTATTQTVTGLVNGTMYTFTVAAVNGVGTGAQSAESNAVTPITVAGTPTGVTATAGAGQATVSWTAPASDGGSPITGYVVTPFVGLVAKPSTTFNSTATTQVVSGLTSATTYRFKVAAINGAGTGPMSTVSNAVTPT